MLWRPWRRRRLSSGKNIKLVWLHVLVQAIVSAKLGIGGDHQHWLHKAMTHITMKFAEVSREGTWREIQPQALKLLSSSEGYSFPPENFDQGFNMFYMILSDMIFTYGPVANCVSWVTGTMLMVVFSKQKLYMRKLWRIPMAEGRPTTKPYEKWQGLIECYPQSTRGMDNPSKR